jgi:hypothetical protein
VQVTLSFQFDFQFFECQHEFFRLDQPGLKSGFRLTPSQGKELARGAGGGQGSQMTHDKALECRPSCQRNSSSEGFHTVRGHAQAITSQVTNWQRLMFSAPKTPVIVSVLISIAAWTQVYRAADSQPPNSLPRAWFGSQSQAKTGKIRS